MALAVDDAYATMPAVRSERHELGHLGGCLVAVEPVQVEPGLHHPVAAAQAPQDLLRQAFPNVGEFLA